MKGGEEKVIFLKVSYQEKVSATNLNNGIYRDNVVVTLDLTDKNIIEEILDNPLTGRYLGIIVLICMMVGLLLLFKDKKKSLYLFLLIGIIIPFTVNALCKHSLEIETNLVIDGKEAIFLPGKEVNAKMKALAENDLSSANSSLSPNELITSIIKSDVEPIDLNKEENIVSMVDSPYPIYMWYEDGIIYWWSEDKTPSLNEDASFMFNNNTSLVDITGLSSFDSSSSHNMIYLFNKSSLLNIDSLASWNMSSVLYFNGMFSNNWSLVDVSGLKEWDVSSVKTMNSLFSCCYELEEIDLRNWKTDSLTNMRYMFASLYYSADYSLLSKLKRIFISDSFDTSKVTTMYGLFYNDRYIEDYSFLTYFDTSSVTDMNCIFQDNESFDNTEYIKDWDVSKVTDFSLAFAGCYSFTNLSGLANWDVSSVEKMERMFYDDKNLTTLDGLEIWDTSNVADMSYMFYGCTNVTSLIPLRNWKTQNVENMASMFHSNTGLTTLDGLENWNTSKVTSMSSMFNAASKLTSINALKNWNVSNVTVFNSMFYNDKLIEDVDSINDWDVQNTATYKYMFRYLSIHPTFTKLAGTWNSSGTFTPSS